MSAPTDVDSDWTYGVHSVESTIAQRPERVRRIIVAKGRQDRRVQAVVAHAREMGLRVESLEKAALDRLVKGVHQGIVAQVTALALATEADLEAWLPTFENPLLLVLENVTDPRNLGACLRAADGAGVDAVLLPERHTAPVGGVVAKTASGALEALRLVAVKNLARRLDWLKAQGVWVIGLADAAPASVYDVDLTGPTALVIGGEGVGLKRLTRDKCDRLAALPMAGVAASLNVSVATGVAAYEAVRQRRPDGSG